MEGPVQARLPDAILRELPPGTPTAPLLAADPATLPPTLAVWIARNGFAAGAVELLPAFVPVPLPAPIELGRRDRRRDRAYARWGGAVLALSLLVPMGLGFGFQSYFGEDGFRGPAFLAVGVLSGFGIWLAYGCLPLVLALAVIGLEMDPNTAETRILLGEDTLSTVLLGVSPAIPILLGFALLARGRGRSPWLALLGVVSLFFRDRDRDRP